MIMACVARGSMDVAGVVIRTFPSEDREFAAFVSEALGALSRSGFLPAQVSAALGPLVSAEYPGARISETTEGEASTVYVVRAPSNRSEATRALRRIGE